MFVCFFQRMSIASLILLSSLFDKVLSAPLQLCQTLTPVLVFSVFVCVFFVYFFVFDVIVSPFIKQSLSAPVQLKGSVGCGYLGCCWGLTTPFFYPPHPLSPSFHQFLMLFNNNDQNMPNSGTVQYLISLYFEYSCSTPVFEQSRWINISFSKSKYPWVPSIQTVC